MITTPAGKLYLNQFTGIKEFFTGNSVDASMYTVLDNNYIAGVYHDSLSHNKIKTSQPLDFFLGEAVLVKSGNFPIKHIVANIGDDNFFLLKNELTNDDGEYLIDNDIIQVKRLSKKTLKLNNLKEGLYIIEPTNQKLIIRNSFQQPFVSLEDLNSELIDITNLKQYRVNQLRNNALKSIYSELSGYDNYYDIIDDVDLWLLSKLKIQCMLYKSDTDAQGNNTNPYCLEYDDKVKSYKPTAKKSENGGVSSNVPDFNYSSGEWSL